MDRQKIHYCFTLSDEQMKFLRSKKYKIDRMECFMSLVEIAERDTKLVQISKTQQVEILRGQLMIDNTQLAKLWDKDRKTVPKILEAMESLGISSSQKVGENRIHTLHSLSGWYVDGHFVGNGFALKRYADKNAITHMDVPPVRVITIENTDDPNKGEDNNGSDTHNSPNGNEGKNTSADSNVSQPSSPSNDSGNVGKSGADDKSSVSSHHDSSLQSVGIPSSDEEAVGNQNGGKRNEHPSAQQGEQSAQPDGIPSAGNGGYNKYPNGYNAPHGVNSDD